MKRSYYIVVLKIKNKDRIQYNIYKKINIYIHLYKTYLIAN